MTLNTMGPGEATTEHLPLTHLKVLDLTHHVAGPYCTKLLADFGADVIKLERPGYGDPARAAGPFPGDIPDPEKSGTFFYLNTNKRSVTVDFSCPSGRDIVLELASWADVMVENFRPRVLPSKGLSPSLLLQHNPRLVLTSISNFGQTGPYCDFEATEIVADAMGGWMYGVGAEEREPLKPPGSQAQMLAGIFAAAATLGANLATESLGQGQHVDVSIMESVLSMLMNITTTYDFSGHIWRRHGGHSPMNHPQGVYRCKDGLIGVNVLYYVEWPRFAELVGHPEWLDDPRFATPLDRARNRELLDEVIVPWLGDRTVAELYHTAQRSKIPFAPINGPQSLLSWPQLVARDYWVDADHSRLGTTTIPGAPFVLSETPWRLRRPAPMLGEHTDEVLCEQLGFERGDLVRLRERGVV